MHYKGIHNALYNSSPLLILDLLQVAHVMLLNGNILCYPYLFINS